MPIKFNDLKRNQTIIWVRTIITYLSMPIILMVCGWDLGWWQAHIFSLLIIVSGVGARIWAEQRHPGLMEERQRIENVQDAKSWDKILALSINLIRIALEDETLKKELPGYREYTKRVRYRLIPDSIKSVRRAVQLNHGIPAMN